VWKINAVIALACNVILFKSKEKGNVSADNMERKKSTLGPKLIAIVSLAAGLSKI